MRRREARKCTTRHLKFGIGGGRGPLGVVGGDGKGGIVDGGICGA